MYCCIAVSSFSVCLAMLMMYVHILSTNTNLLDTDVPLSVLLVQSYRSLALHFAGKYLPLKRLSERTNACLNILQAAVRNVATHARSTYSSSSVRRNRGPTSQSTAHDLSCICRSDFILPVQYQEIIRSIPLPPLQSCTLLLSTVGTCKSRAYRTTSLKVTSSYLRMHFKCHWNLISASRLCTPDTRCNLTYSRLKTVYHQY